MDTQRTPKLTRRAQTALEEWRATAPQAAAAGDDAGKAVVMARVRAAVKTKEREADGSITECKWHLQISNDKDEHINKSESELDATCCVSFENPSMFTRRPW